MKMFTIACVFLLMLSSTYAKDYNVTSFGAVGDGTTLNTHAIQNAIDKISNRGGGRLVFNKGKYLTGSIVVRSNVNLLLSEDAVLLGSTNPMDYKRINIGRNREVSSNDNSKLALILADGSNNISISGNGTIDGQGLELALTIDSLHHAGVCIDEKYNYRRMRPNETARPKLLLISNCNNVDISNVKLRNSSCWGATFELCTQISINDVKIFNRAYWNNDGLDITDCKNVYIRNCDVNSADDGICLKSYNKDSCNDSIRIENCTIRSSASAIKFGTASWGGFKNISIDNVNVFDTFRSAIAIESVDGGNIENINISNVVARNSGNALFIRLGHRAGDRIGTVKNISINGLKAEIPFTRPDIDYDLRGPEVNFFHNPFPSSIVGLEGNCIENVKIENVDITYPGRATKGMAYIPITDLSRVPECIDSYPEFSMFGELPAWGMYVRHVKGLEMDNIKFSLKSGDFRPSIVMDDVDMININKTSIYGNNRSLVFRGVSNENIQRDLDIVRVKK